MEMIVNLKEHSYPIYIEKNILNQSNDKIKEIFKGKKIMIISDDQVYPLYGNVLTSNLEKDFEVGHVVVPHGEKSKTGMGRYRPLRITPIEQPRTAPI